RGDAVVGHARPALGAVDGVLLAVEAPAAERDHLAALDGELAVPAGRLGVLEADDDAEVDRLRLPRLEGDDGPQDDGEGDGGDERTADAQGHDRLLQEGDPRRDTKGHEGGRAEAASGAAYAWRLLDATIQLLELQPRAPPH